MLHRPGRSVTMAALAATCALTACAGHAHAQEDSSTVLVSGVIGDAQSGMAVSNAVVAIPDLGVQTLTDENGRFVINVSRGRSAVWIFQALGYADWSEEIVPQADEYLRVGLLPQPVVLETIVAAASRLSERRKSVALSVRALSWHDIQSTVATTLAEVVADRSPHPIVDCPGPIAAEPPPPPPSQHPSRVVPRRLRAPPGGADAGIGLCMRWRGKTISPQIWLDEQLTPVPLDALHHYMPHEIYTVEYYQHPGRGPIIRIYTVAFMKSGKSLLPSSALFR